jgi:predicted dienelactone hydrolase
MKDHARRRDPATLRFARGAHRTPRRCRAAMVGLALAALLVGCGGGDDVEVAEPTGSTVQPLALPGPFAIACSNVAQDFSRLPPGGEDAKAHWEGKPAADGTPRYLSDLLTDPANALSITVDVPNDSDLYGSFAGKPVGFSVLACYPTTADNPRPDFAMPTGQRVPHMHVGAEAPLFADASARYPIIAFSHGLAGSPLSDDHFVVLSWLASHGYVVVAPFHGDPRFTNLQIDNFGDVVAVLTNLNDAIAMQALRPLSVSAALDLMLAHPHWRDHLDATQIGGFGASLGGETLLLLAGAAMTTSPGLSSKPIGVDRRLKAAVGYVPYFGQALLPAFGRDQSGLDGVTLPYLAIGGTADTTAPLAVTQQGVARLAGPRQLVVLSGLEHGFDPASASDILTWSLTFLDARVRGLQAAVTQLSTMTRVAGGADDRLVISQDGPAAP